MHLNSFIQIGLPVSLALIMLSLGLAIRLADFTRQIAAPWPLIVGLFAQLLLVPMLALAIVVLFTLPPVLAAGLMILSFCPGGVTSNWFSHMAQANVPLSISLTVVASLITPFTIPLLSELAVQTLTGESQKIHIPLGFTMLRLFVISVLPVAIGICLRHQLAEVCQRWQPLIYRLASALFLGVIFAIILAQQARLPGFMEQAGIASLSVIVAGMGIGSLLAKLAQLKRKDSHTITIEVGMQNGGMALVVTQNVLQNAELSIVPIVYGLIMLLPIYLFSRYARTQSV